MRMILAFALALLCAPHAYAQVLVSNCSTPSTGGCAATSAWVRTTQATNVQVLRTGVPFVSLATVQPTERIAACYDPAMVAGSTAKCTTPVPGRTDLWQLKSVLFPLATGGSLVLMVDAANPKWDSGAALPANLLPDLYVRLYGAEQGQVKTLLDAAVWANSLKFRRDSASTAVFCFAASLALDTTGDKIPDRESAPTAEWCGRFTDATPTLNLLPPNGITGQTPAT